MKNKNIEKWINTADELLKRLYSYRSPGVCRYLYGDPPGCEGKEFDDDMWDQVLLYQEFFERFTELEAVENLGDSVKAGIDWALEDGPITLRKHLLIPDMIEGIPTGGTEIRLWMEMLNSIQIYVDGELVTEYTYWADSRRCEIRLCENYEAGREHVVTFRIPKGEGDAHMLVRFKIDAIEERILELSAAIEQVRFACRIADFHKAEFAKALGNLEELLDIKHLRDRDWKKIERQLLDIDECLKSVDHFAKDYTVHIIGHAHLDMDWLWSYENTVETCLNDVRTICDILDEFPDFRYSMSQAGMYEIVEKNAPALFERVKKKIKEGQWEVTAGAWVENDLNMAGGDYIVRQIKLADYAVRHLETGPSEIFFEPDCFGHPATMPDILARAGIKYYYHMRCPQKEGIYWWQGKGGCRILDFAYGNYANEMTPSGLMDSLYKMIDENGLHQTMFMFGIGDHGGGPSRKDISIKQWLDTKACFPRLHFSTTKEFFEGVLKEEMPLAVHTGEQNFTFEGTYTLKSRIKKAVRDSERALLDAEAMLAYLGTEAVTSCEETLQNEWKSGCFLGFHDIIAGCNTSHADDYHMELARHTLSEANRIKEQCAEEYFEERDQNFTVLNQLGFERTEIIEVPGIKSEMSGKAVVDGDGNFMEYQLHNGKLCLVDKVPGFSVKSYGIVNGIPVRKENAVKITREKEFYCLENEYISLKVSTATGAVASLWDKETGQSVLRENILAPAYSFPNGYCGHNDSNVIRIEKEAPHYWGAWILGRVTDIHYVSADPQLKIIEEGPVRATLRVRHMFGDSWFEQSISVSSGLKRVDFSLNMSWREMGDRESGIPVAKIEFTCGHGIPEAFYEIPMGETGREGGSAEYPAYRYVRWSGKKNSCLLVSDYKHGFEVNGDKLRMTVARASYSPDRKPEEGEMETKYSLRLLSPDASEAEAVCEADSFDRPFLVFPGKKRDSEERRRLMSENGNVVITSVKPYETGKGITAYLRNTSGTGQSVTMRIGREFSGLVETDLTERIIVQSHEIENGKIELRFRPYEIKIIILQ